MFLVRILRLISLLLFVVILLFVPQVSFTSFTLPVEEKNWFRETDAVFPAINVQDYPVLNGLEPLPEISAQASVIMDMKSKVPIWSLSEQAQVYPASTTKLMTALVALDHYDMDAVLTFPPLEIFPAVMGLRPGEKIKAKDALAGLLISSGNDAALLFAENYPTGYTGFVQAMNKKAHSLGLNRTYYFNPSGLHQEGHITTAIELAHLVSVALEQPTIRALVMKQRMVVYGIKGEKHQLFSTDELLGKLGGLVGGKTGFTNEAGGVLVTLTERNGRSVVCVVMKSEDRFKDTQMLVNWTFRNVVWHKADSLPIR